MSSPGRVLVGESLTLPEKAPKLRLCLPDQTRYQNKKACERFLLRGWRCSAIFPNEKIVRTALSASTYMKLQALPTLTLSLLLVFLEILLVAPLLPVTSWTFLVRV